jgi:hypothetical protein
VLAPPRAPAPAARAPIPSPAASDKPPVKGANAIVKAAPIPAPIPAPIAVPRPAAFQESPEPMS